MELVVEQALAARLAAFAAAWDLANAPVVAGKAQNWVAHEVFEIFATHAVINGIRHQDVDRNDVLALMTGGIDDAKLDAIGLFVDGALILSEEDLMQALDEVSEASLIDFVFVQATLMDYLAQGKVEKSCTGIANFAAVRARLSENDQIRHWRRLKEILLRSLEQKGITRKPRCTLYIVWPTPLALLSPDHHGILELRRQDIERLDLFQEVTFRLVDGPELMAISDSEERRNVVTLPFAELTAFRDDAVTANSEVESWSGRLVAADFVEALQGPDGELRPEFFAENVRLFQGAAKGSVNEAIGETLASPARSCFHLFNNGLTLVARAVRQTGALALECHDLKVINGCQTSFSLHLHRLLLDSSVKVAAKIIATQDRELVDLISVASNRQTAIAPVEFFSRLPFVRRVQLQFDMLRTADGERVLWLERQRGERAQWPRDYGQRVLDIEDMIRAYASIVLERPELVQSGGWKALRALVPHSIFNPAHDLEIYEIAGLVYWRAREAMGESSKSEHYPAKNHLMLAMRLLADPSGLRPDPMLRPSRDRSSTPYVKQMREALLSDRRARQIGQDAHQLLHQVAKSIGRPFNAKTFATVDATHRLLDMASRRNAAE